MEDLILRSIKESNELKVINTACPWRRLEIKQDPNGWYLLTSIAQNIDGIEEAVVSHLKICINSKDLITHYLKQELKWVQGDTSIDKLKLI